MTSGADCGLLRTVLRTCRLALASALLASLSLSTSARAFDDAFKPLGFTWDVSARPIPVSIEPNGSDDIDDGSDIQAVKAALNAWACAEGTALRFEVTDEPGVVDNAADNINSIFWDESGDICLMGPGVLGIGGGDGTQGDVCFNGLHHTWGVGANTDVQSIAMHEIGHFIGFAHPCDNDDDQASCLPSGDAVMFPAWDGENQRDLRKSEKAGVKELYPAVEGSTATCAGPFGPGERCGCNDECVDGLVCVPDPEGTLRCGKACASDAADCGVGATCVLDVPQDGNAAPGVCVAVAGVKPAGAICTQGGECESGTCIANIDIGRSICIVPCDVDDDCAGGSCFNGICLGGFESQECPELPVEDCACDATSSRAFAPGAFVVAALMLSLRRRRGRNG